MLFPSGYGREVHLGAVASGCVTWYSSTILGVGVVAQKVQPESSPIWVEFQHPGFGLGPPWLPQAFWGVWMGDLCSSSFVLPFK